MTILAQRALVLVGLVALIPQCWAQTSETSEAASTTALDERFDHLEAENKEVRRQLIERDKALAEAAKREADLQVELQDMQRRSNDMEQELAALREQRSEGDATAAAASAQSDQQAADLELLRTKLTGLEEEAAQLQAQLAERDTALSRVNDNLAKLEGELASAKAMEQQALQTGEAQASSLEQERDTALGEIKRLSDLIAESKQDLEQANDERASLESSLQEGMTALDEHKASLEDQQQQLSQAQDKLAAAQTKLNESQSKLTAAEADSAALQTALDESQSKLAAAEADKAALQTALDESHAKLAAAEGDSAASQTKLTESQSKLASELEQREALASNVEQMRSKVTELEQEIDAKRTELERQTSALQAESDNNASLQEQIQLQESKLTELERQTSELQAASDKNTSLQEQMQVQEAKLTELDSDLKAARAEVDALTLELSETRSGYGASQAMLSPEEGGTAQLHDANGIAFEAMAKYLNAYQGKPRAVREAPLQDSELKILHEELFTAQSLVARLTDARGIYTVRPGDTLAIIGAKVMGDSACWTLIFETNKHVLPSSNDIVPGQVLVIPPRNG